MSFRTTSRILNTYEIHEFPQQYGPEHGPPMTALLRWMKEEVTGLKGAFVSDDDELEVVH